MIIHFVPSARLTADAVKLLTYAFKGHRFTPDGVIVPITSTKVLQQAEETVATLERALAHGKNPAQNGANSSPALAR
jgi:hypothetical protein